MFIIRFGVWSGVGVQKFKMCWSRSGVGVYAAEGGAESESKISESVHLWCPAMHNTFGVTAPFSHICSWCELHYILWIFAKIIFMIVLALNSKNEIWKSWSWSGNLKKTVLLSDRVCSICAESAGFEFWKPVSSQISDLRNFWLRAMYAMHKVIFYKSISLRKLMISVSVWFLGECVGLGFGLGLENEKNWGVRLSQIFFSGHNCSHTIVTTACCVVWHLIKKF